MLADIFVADKGQRVFGLVMADCVADYLGVNYFALTIFPSVIFIGPCDNDQS